MAGAHTVTPGAVILFTLGLLAVPGAATTLGRRSFGQETADAPRITQQEFRKLLAARNVIVVDTRNAEAFPAGHIPGALLLPLEGQLTWSEAYQRSVVEKLKTARKPIVTYCA
jgi:predicted sulfurtransferase